MRDQLDNLIWKGSELASSMRLKDIDIKSTLKELEAKWNEAMQLAQDRVAELHSLRMDWAERERILASLEAWLSEAEEHIESEKTLPARDETSLRDALDNYQVRFLFVIVDLFLCKQISTCLHQYFLDVVVIKY